MNGLTPRQQETLDFLRSCDQSPSYTEIGRHLGIMSRGAVQSILNRLEDRGFIKRHPGMARSITLVEPDLSAISTDALRAELARRAA